MLSKPAPMKVPVTPFSSTTDDSSGNQISMPNCAPHGTPPPKPEEKIDFNILAKASIRISQTDSSDK